LLIDLNLRPLWVSFLAEFGFDSIHWSSIGEASAPDVQILDFAGANGLIVFTHDLDFGALLASRKTRQPSVIQVRTQNVLPAAIGGVVVRALQASRRQLEEGALVTVDPNSAQDPPSSNLMNPPTRTTGCADGRVERLWKRADGRAEMRRRA
jgi:predicted nuclease of predicted toxin-antitoxin system